MMKINKDFERTLQWLYETSEHYEKAKQATIDVSNDKYRIDEAIQVERDDAKRSSLQTEGAHLANKRAKAARNERHWAAEMISRAGNVAERYGKTPGG